MSICNSLYHDYATEPELKLASSLSADSVVLPKHGRNSFPEKLHFMLSDVAKDGLDHIVSWQWHGRSFMVHDQEAFVKRMLPLYFQQHSYASFQRQLNLYEFRRITSGRDKGSYYHELFLYGKFFLTQHIKRHKTKGTGYRRPSPAKKEPNFYSMPFLTRFSPATTEMKQSVSLHPTFPLINQRTHAPSCRTGYMDGSLFHSPQCGPTRGAPSMVFREVNDTNCAVTTSALLFPFLDALVTGSPVMDPQCHVSPGDLLLRLPFVCPAARQSSRVQDMGNDSSEDCPDAG